MNSSTKQRPEPRPRAGGAKRPLSYPPRRHERREGRSARLCVPIATNEWSSAMPEISASRVMELRQRTGVPMMECKKALSEAGGDLARAEELLRIAAARRPARHRPGSPPKASSALPSTPTRRSPRWSSSIAKRTSSRRTTTFARWRTRSPASSSASTRPTSRRWPDARSRRAKPSTRGASRSCRRSARTSRCAASCGSKRRVASRRTCMARGSACWSTIRAATKGSARISRCTSPRRSRWRCRASRCRPAWSTRSARSPRRVPPSRASLPTSPKKW